MAHPELDSVDEGILFLLQEDARNVTTKSIGERLNIASSTVANRIRKLEQRGIIRSYQPDIDYARTEYDHHLLVIGSVQPEADVNPVEDTLDVRGVIEARELLTDEQNLSLELLGANQEDIVRTIERLREVGVSVIRTEILKRELTQPFDEFGEHVTDE
ncbi:Lrp/AsnC family transcriptional regulator [Halostella pelagica]|uniref:Lrp/AsnC family transcriptional regulator n=1 Tax=Halostella pelagica TaxID=2583824 RepID=UPI00108104C0|nr:Lrp/AsnC family transcriptional regulator [Halostella pelagica]